MSKYISLSKSEIRKTLQQLKKLRNKELSLGYNVETGYSVVEV